MDARIESSLKRMKEAYLHEKRRKLIPEIKVVDICKKAGVNKTTFYRHYRDIYDLADEVEREVVKNIIEQLQHKDKLLTQPELFVKESMQVFEQNTENIKWVFDQRYGVLIDKVEKEHVEYFSRENYSAYEALLIKFCIGGAAHIMTGNMSKEETESVQEFLIKMMKKMCE